MHVSAMIIFMILAVLSLNLCCANPPETPANAAPNMEALQKAAAASLAWVTLLDKGKYGESWDQSSLIMKSTIKKDEWIKAMEKTHKPYGSVKSRKVLDQRTAKNPHGLPAGDYMVMYYATDFTHKPNGKELVTLFLENGEWRVLTYQAS